MRCQRGLPSTRLFQIQIDLKYFDTYSSSSSNIPVAWAAQLRLIIRKQKGVSVYI